MGLTFLRRRPNVLIVAGCYLCGLLVWLAVHAGLYLDNRSAYRKGELAPAELGLEHLDMNEDIALQPDGSLITTGADPQLYLKNGGLQVENVTLLFSYNMQPGPVTVYWRDEGKEYSLRRVAYPLPQENASQSEDPSQPEDASQPEGAEEDVLGDMIKRLTGKGEIPVLPTETDPIPGEQSFLLPTQGVYNLRIDPGTTPGARIQIERILINQPRSLGQFFRMSAGEAILLVVVPGLVACVLSAVVVSGLTASIKQRFTPEEVGL